MWTVDIRRKMGLEHATTDGLLMGDPMAIRPSPIACDSLIAIIGNASADLPSYLHAAAVRNLGKRRWLADSACHIPFEPPLFVEDVVRTSVESMAKDPPAAQAGYNNLFTERNYHGCCQDIINLGLYMRVTDCEPTSLLCLQGFVGGISRFLRT